MLEYIIDDPSLLQEVKPPLDSTSSTGSDDEQQSSKHKFAQIKARFEQKSVTNVMASPSSSSVASSNTTTPRRNSNTNNRTNVDIPPAPPMLSNASNRSQTSSVSSFRRVNSADEADEEVQRIHRQGEQFRQHQDGLTPIDENNQQPPPNVEYEVVDEDGNPMAIDGVQDLIKMSGVTAREVPQPDGTIIREYVIDDPHILSKFQAQQSPTNSQQRTLNNDNNNNIPPPPPRVPLKQSALFRQGPSNDNNNNVPLNIQQIHVIEPQRRYEYVTTSGKRIEFMITNIGPTNQMTNDTDIRELSHAINTRLLPSGSTSTPQPFTLPKQWHPAVDLTHREGSTRQRTGSDSQPVPPNNYNVAYQQAQPVQPDVARSASYGTLNQGPYQQPFAPVFTEPIIDWSAIRQQDPHGQVDPQLIQQFITQKHQTGSFQSSAQFLPEQPQPKQQTTRSTISPSRTTQPVFYQQQQMSYPYQGQQQHGVTIYPTNTDYNLNQQQQQQQQATMFVNGNTRI